MNRSFVNSLCETFPGAEVSDPWSKQNYDGKHDAWKVGGKMFASIGAQGVGVSVKTDSIETAEMLIEMGVGTKAKYFHRSWVNLPFGDAAPSEDEFKYRLAASYQIIRSGLTKKVQSQLTAFEMPKS